MFRGRGANFVQVFLARLHILRKEGRKLTAWRSETPAVRVGPAEDMSAVGSSVAGSAFPASGPAQYPHLKMGTALVTCRVTEMSYFGTLSSVPRAFINVITSGKRFQEEEEFGFVI